MTDGAEPESELSAIHYFVDEAGDPTLFSAKGEILVGTEGCSNYFMLGKLDVADPVGLCRALEELRATLLADPYFKRVPSMQVAAKKTAKAFHANNDLQEVRWAVFKELAKHEVKFYGVVRDKHELTAYVKQQNERESKYRYSENEQYDTLVNELFKKLRRPADRMEICFARRGAKDRTQALNAALESAGQEFERNFGFKQPCETVVTAGHSASQPCLQAADYFLWAVQRFFEKDEERFVELIWPQVGEIHDLDFMEGKRRGVFYRKDKPLTLAAREAHKKSRGI